MRGIGKYVRHGLAGITAALALGGLVAPAEAATKFWSGLAGDGLWASAGNWSGGAPAATDTVRLDNSLVGATYTVTLPTGAVGTSIARLYILPGAGLNITLTLPSGNTAAPGLNVGDNTAATDDITIGSGGTLVNASTAASGNGIQGNSTTNGIVKILNGGRYQHKTARSIAGIVPLLSAAAGTENGEVEYDVPGTSAFAITASGRTYGNLTLTRTAGAATYSAAGGSALTIRGNFKLNTGVTFSSTMTGAMNLQGNLQNGGTITPTAGQAWFFNGSAAQSVTGATTLVNVTLNNANGLSLNNDLTVNGTLTLTAGRITTGANKVAMGGAGTVAGAGSTTYVNGNLQKPVSVGGGSFSQSFEVGDATTYAPVSIASDSPAPGPSGNVMASTSAGDHAQIATSGINPAKSVNRTWTLTNGGLGFATYAATFNFANPGDVDGGAVPANFNVARYTGGSWFATTPGTRTATSTEATGIASMSDFQVGELAPVNHTITATAGAGGNISPFGLVSVPGGTDQTFTITPDPCFSILDVTVDGLSVGAQTSYTFTNVTADHTIDATFTAASYTITSEICSDANVAGGSFQVGDGGTISPLGIQPVACGGSLTFTITPDPCFHIVDVRVDGLSVGTPTSYTFSNVQASHNICAKFAIDTYTITASAGPGGSINPAGPLNVNCGSDQAYTITPDPCYMISGVFVDGSPVGSGNDYTFTNVQANHTISATFIPLTYTITASAGPGGSISPDGGTQVNCGALQSYIITPDPCYAISDVVVDGISQGPVANYTFTNVQAAHTISATFVINVYTISISYGPGGTGNFAGNVEIPCGDPFTVDFFPDPCYQVADVLVDGISVGHPSSYTFTNITANHTLFVQFAPLSYTITASSGPHGAIDPSGAVAVNCGGDQTFTFIADPCYIEADVIVDGVSQGPLGSYTFTNVTADHTISVTWTLATYTLTASAGPGGSITPAGAVGVDCGGDQTFTITPDPCYVIADVKVDNVSVGAVGSYTFTNVTANHTIAATFAQTSYTITATAGPNGSIAPVGAVSVACGADQSFVITPSAGFAIDDVLVDAVSVGPVANYAFTAVGANHTIHATFKDSECPAVTVTAPNGGETYIIGMPLNITWTATDNVGVTCVDIELSRTGAGGPFTPIISCIANLGSYAWTVTGPATPNAVIRVVGHDAAGNSCYDDSDAEFAIINFVVPVLLSQFQANPVDNGVELRWTMADPAMFARTGIERAEALAGPFAPLSAAVRVENGQSILLDRDVSVGTTYYYRLAGVTRSGQVVTFEPLSAIAGQPVTEFALPVVSPNPIRSVAQVSFSVPREARVRVTVVDIQGRPVATLADGHYTPGRYQVSWSGDSESGAAPSGIYFIRLDAPATKLVQRVVLVH